MNWFVGLILKVENLKPYNSCNLQVDVDAKFLAYFISFTNI